MAEHYSGLEVAHTERVQSSPEVVDYSSFAPQRASLSHDSPEVVSQPTFASNAAHNSLLSDGDGTDTKKWHPQTSPPPDQSGFLSPGLTKKDSGLAPETEPTPEKETYQEGVSPGKQQTDPKRRRILLWIVVGLLALVAVVVGIGVGVGVGLRNRNANKSRHDQQQSPKGVG
ncbi:MAG: hypothetical protein Q9195_004476 [Heterodermia aff. obscurata]